MLIGTCKLFIYLPQCQSLKDKRSIIKKVKKILADKYNISIAEIGQKDVWKNAIIGIGCIGDNRAYIDQNLNHIVNDIEKYHEVQLINFEISIN